jgi:hypothetical protein
MSDLGELIKKRQDELRGREEDWIDRLFDWWRCCDGWDLAFMIWLVPQVLVLAAIELWAIGSVVAGLMP